MKPFLCIPSWDGNITVDTFRSLWGVIQGAVLNDALLHVQNHDVVRVRNRAAYEFLRSDCSHLWFVDADVGFSPDVPRALFESGLDFCAAVYPKKAIHWGVPRTRMLDWPFKPLVAGECATVNGHAYQRAEFLPMGCTLIDRGVVEAVSAKADCYSHPFTPGGEVHQIPNIFGQLMYPDPGGDTYSLLPEDISKITIRTHEACVRIIDKKGPLDNPADRDHCIQYMVAVPILFGRLTAQDYEDTVARDPRIDRLRDKIVCVENKAYTKDYHDPEKRSIANALTVEFSDGKRLKEIVVEYPIGHKRRRKEGMPVLMQKFATNLARVFPARQAAHLLALANDNKALDDTPVHEFVDLMVI